MRDEDKTKGQLVSELDKMRQQFAVMEAQKAEWKRTEQVLRNLEQRYRILLEETPLGIMSVDIKGKITYVNNIILEHTGYSLDDLVGKNAFRLGLVTSETLSLLRKRLREKLMGEPPSPLIIQLKCKDGEWIWLEIRGKVLQKHGLPIGVQIIGEDITERKQAEERLSRSEENYKNVFDLAPDGILTVNTKGVVISCNAAFSNLSGFSKGEIVGKHFLKLPTLIKKDIPIYLKTFASLLKGEISKPMEFAWKHKDGTQRLGEAHISLMKREGKILGLQVIIRDVTERKRMEEELRKLNTISESTFFGADIATPEGEYTYVNESFARMHGYTRDEMVGIHWSRLFPGEQLEFIRQQRDHLLKEGDTFTFETERLRKDGSTFPSITTGAVVRDSKGNPLFTSGIIVDITERKQAEEALWESEQRYIHAEKLGQFGHWRRGFIYKEATWSAGTYRIFGVEPDQFKPTQENIYHLIHPDDKEAVRRTRDDASLRGEKFDIEYRIIRPNGEERVLHSMADVYTDINGKRKGLFGTIIDITERKQAEEALLESEERYRAIVDLGASFNEAIIMTQDTGQGTAIHIYANEEWSRITGYSNEELIGTPYMDVIHPKNRREVLDRYKRRLKGEVLPSTYEFSVIRKDGAEVLLEAVGNFTMYRGKSATVAYLRDITGRKQAQEELRESEERYRAIIDLGAKVGEAIVMLQDTEKIIGRYVFVSDEWTHITGYSREELLGMSQADLIHPRYRAEAVERHHRRMRGETISELFEISIIRKDGAEVPIELTGAYTTYQGMPAHVVYMRDITERKRAEEEIAKFKTIADNAGYGVVIGDQENKIIYANEAYSQISGYSIDELTGQDVRLLYPEEQLDNMLRLRNKLMQEGRYTGEEVWHRRKDGTIFPTLMNGTAVKDKNGVPLFRAGSIIDITERKRAEEALHLRANLLNSANDSITVADLEGNIIYANDAACRIRGYTLDEMVQLNFRDTVTPKHAGLVEGRIKRAIEEGDITFESEHKRKDGSVFSMEMRMHTVKVGDRSLIMSISRDITERKRAEEILQASELKYRTLHDTMAQGVIYRDINGELISMNPAAKRILGLKEKQIKTVENIKDHMKIIHEDGSHYPIEESPAFLSLRTGKPVYKQVMSILNQQKGGFRWLSVNAVPQFRPGEDKPYQVFITFSDITERKLAEEEIAKFKTIADIASYGVAIGPIKKLDYVNRSFAEMHGYSPDELIGKHYSILYTEEQLPVINRLRAHLLKTGGFINKEVWHKRKDGTLFPTLMAGSLIKDEEGNPSVIAGTVIDITERKQMEEERLKFEKLESIGTLAGGIAHDFNNILTGIMGNITLAERHVEPGGKAAERLLEAMKASLRARDLTQQMLTFARGGAPVKKTVSIAELLEDSATFALRGSKVKCEFSLPDDLWPVEIDEGQISQVITNLVINADEAMPEGGIINIGAKNTAIKRKGVLPLAKGNYVEITMKDEGIGIAKEHLDRIFDPYFTTKQKGSGLGLATTYSIIKNHDGRITVESELGTGTTFRIYLPASKKPSLVKKEAADDAPVRGKGRILVMDDEEMIREMLSNLLSTAGYEVELTSDGAEAIERYAKAKESGQPFGAVIMDLTIPGGMGGKEAIGKLLEIDPDTMAIVSSGYSADPIMAKFRKYGFSAVATKPYSAGELERTLHRLITRDRRKT